MVVAKVSLRALRLASGQAPRSNLQGKQGEIASSPFDKFTAPRNDKMSPQDLLDSLKAKQHLYEKLKTEGLIHQGQHKAMETKLKETIAELEILIPKLEVC